MQSYQKFLAKHIIPVLTGLVILFLTVPPALAQEGAQVYLQPVASEGDTLTFEVIAENVTEMYGAEFRLTYDPAVLAVQDTNPDQEGIQIEPGTLLPADKGFVVANEVNETEGTVVFAMTLLNPAPAANGAGPLAQVTFKRLQNSPSTLNVEHAKLVARDLQTIPSQTAAFAVEAAGQDQPVTPAGSESPAGGFPWWIVAAAIIGLGILGLGSLIIIGGSKGEAAKPKNVIKSQTSPAGGSSGSRPSAFKQQTFPPDVPHKSQ